MPCLSPQRILLKPTRTYSRGSSCPFQHFFFFFSPFSTWVPAPSSRGLTFEGSGTLSNLLSPNLPQNNVESLYLTHSWPLFVKVYRGDFLGTLALARTPHTQATENR